MIVIEKTNIKNAYIVARKLELILIRSINYRFDVIRKNRQKWEEMKERQERKVIATKLQSVGGVISLSSKEKKIYENDIENKTNLDNANDKYLL